MLFSWLFIYWFLQMPTFIWIIATPSCLSETKHHLYHDGTVIIGAFFPIFYLYPLKERTNWESLSFDLENDLRIKGQNYQLVLAMLFAINEINWNSHILPNTSLGLEIYTLPHYERNVLRSVLYWLTGLSTFIPNYSCREESKSVAALTGISWKISENIGRLLNLYKFPQLAFGPFEHFLTDRRQFPSLYQVAPKEEASLFYGIAVLMLYFNWTWVGLLITDDHSSIQFISDLRKELDKNKLCIAFVSTVSLIGEAVYYVPNDFWVHILESSANVIIIYTDIAFLFFKIENSYRKHILRKVWVTTSKVLGSKFREYNMLNLSHGILTFSPHHGEILGFTNFMQEATPIKYPDDSFLHVLWNWYFNCPLSHSDCKILENCMPNASLELLPGKMFDMVMSEESYNVYNAVYAIAHSLHEMLLNQYQIQPQATQDRNTLLPWQLHPFLKNIQVKNSAGDHVVLDWKRKADPEYDITNLWNFPTGLSLFVNVGTFTPLSPQGQQLSLSEYMIQWPIGFTETPQSVCSESCNPGFRKVVLENKLACCFDCTPCPDNEISNETDMDQCVKCPETHYANAEKRHCLKKTVTFLSYNEPSGMGLTIMSVGFSGLTALVFGVFVNHRNTPIVKANNRSLSYILLVTLTLCFLCPLFFIGFPNTATCILQQNVFRLLFTVALSSVLAKTITVVMAFQITAPGRKTRWLLISRVLNFIIPVCTLMQVLFSGVWLVTSPPFVEMDAHSEHGHIIILCNKGSTLAFYGTLAYLGVLAFSSYFLAFLSRNLPDIFNEAKFLAFSMLVFCSVWVTFLPVYHSTTGKAMLIMEIFSILASSASLLSLIFVPKCYIILFRSEKNTLHQIRSKRHQRSKNLLKT
ncbi:vomeronasal type-2 receptor 116-like [Mastomys coucha]|uniref:vomeronasal type-2 receptor 116-like n=1 Tax=Mastomys coucha TaxID=35658 RepID=UPI001261A6CF|nr:vomeronasal type-2 receptor 116-like [Mastomys coucha]